MTESMTDRVVMIAGATGNLGEAVVRRFEAAGERLALLDRSMGRLRAYYPDLSTQDRHFRVECIDMTDPALVEQAAAEVREKFGRADVFVSLVGGYRAGMPLHETPISTFDFLMNLNTRSFHISARAVIPMMVANHYGKIITVSARPGLEGRKNAGAYSAAKGALIRLVESMAEELKERGINVNCVLPGTMDTPENREDMPDADFSRWVPLESVADVIAFLASDAARDIHGASVPVFGLS